MKLKNLTCILVAASIFIVNSVGVFAESNYPLGDVDRDGYVTANDSATILQHVIDPVSMPFDEEQEELAQVNSKNGPITAADALLVLNKSADETYYFPIETTETTTDQTTESTTEATTESSTESTTEGTTESDSYSIKWIEGISSSKLKVTLNKATDKPLSKDNFYISCPAGKDMTILNITTEDNRIYNISTAYYADNKYILNITLPDGKDISREFRASYEAPQITSVMLKRTSEEAAEISYLSDTAGYFYYLVIENEISKAKVLSRINENEITEDYIVKNGINVGMDDKFNKIEINNLKKDIPYTLLCVADNGYGKRSTIRVFDISAKAEDNNSPITILNANGYESNYFVFELSRPTETKLKVENFEITCPHSQLNYDRVESTDNKTYIVREKEGTKFLTPNTFTVKITFDDGTVASKSFHVDNELPKIDLDSLRMTSDNVATIEFRSSKNGIMYYKAVSEMDYPDLNFGTSKPILPKDIDIFNGNVINIHYGTNIIEIEGAEAYQYFCICTENIDGSRLNYCPNKQIKPYKAPVQNDIVIEDVKVSDYGNSSKLEVSFNKPASSLNIDTTLTTLSGGNISGKLLFSISKEDNKCIMTITNLKEPLSKGKYILKMYDNNSYKYIYYIFTI